MKALTLTILTLILVSGCSFKEDTPTKVIEVTKEPEQEQLKTDLFQAVLNNDYNAVENLIKNGAPLEDYDKQGHTVLMRAVQMRNSIMVNILLDGGAKVFTPLENEPNTTAYSKVNPSDTEILGFFNTKINNLSKKVRDQLHKGDYATALAFIKSENLPLSIKSDQDSLPEMIFASIQSNDPNAIELIKYLFDGRKHEQISASDYKDQLLQLTTNLKNANFFDYAVGKLVSVNLPNAEYLVEADAEDTQWLTSKLSTLLKYQIQPPFETTEQYVLKALTQSIQKNEGVDSHIRLYNQLLSFGYTDHQKNLFTQKNIDLILAAAKVNKQLLVILSKTIETWANHKIAVTGYSLDIYVVSILTILQGTNYDYDSTRSAITSLLNFTSNRESLKTIEFISTAQLTSGQKNDLIDLVLSYINKLPKGILAIVAKSETAAILNKLLSSNIPLNEDEQADAVLAAVQNSKSGDTAKTILLILKEKNISFGTQYGADALKSALQKLWNKDETYSPVVDFLLSIPDSPINFMSEAEKLALLKTHLKFVLTEKKNYSQLAQMLQKMDGTISAETYVLNNYQIGDKKYNLRISFVWEFILTMFESYRKSPNEADQMFIILNEVLKKFSSERMAMGIIEEHTIFDPDTFFTQKIFPLSVLFWAGKENIESVVLDKTVPSSLATYQSAISLDTLASSYLFAYYSQEKTFWANIIQSLIANKFKIFSVNSRSYIDLLKIISQSDGFSRFPSLAQQVGISGITLDTTDMGCKFSSSKYGDIISELGSDSESGKQTYWTNLGTFEALKPLQIKSCNGLRLSSEEVKFAKLYIPLNLETPMVKDFIEHEGSTVVGSKCTPTDFFGKPLENTNPYGREYTELGTATKKVPLSLGGTVIDPIKILTEFQDNSQCYNFIYRPSIHAMAKRIFLRDWMACAATANDHALILELQTNDSKYQFSSETGKVNLCGW